MSDLFEKRFNIAPLINNGQAVLQIRRHIINKEDIELILKEILTKGEIKILATVKFRDPRNARKRLKELEIYPDL